MPTIATGARLKHGGRATRPPPLWVLPQGVDSGYRLGSGRGYRHTLFTGAFAEF